MRFGVIGVLSVWLVSLSCSPVVMDDFFGIQMNPEERNDFHIIDYSPRQGARYQSNVHMNPLVYAYAEIYLDKIHIKVVNLSKTPILYDYDLDEFYLFKKDKHEKFILIKEDREKYPDKGIIRPEQEQEFTVLLPMNFWETIGMRNPQSHNASYTTKFWKGENTLEFQKNEIDYLQVVLNGDTSIILKPIPEKKNSK